MSETNTTAEVAAEMVYVVQMQVTMTDTAKDGTYVDDALRGGTETVAMSFTKRATVIKRALAEADIRPNADGTMPRLRALDADSFEVHEPEAHQPPMEWRL